MRIVRPLVQTVGDVGHRVRDLGRLQEVASVLMRHGLGMLVSGLDIPGLAPAGDPLVPRTFQSTPERVVAAIVELGPTFVKLGQVLSTRPDVLPAEYITALEQLQDDVDPLPFSDIEASLSRQLGDDWRTRVAVLNETPLATASIAQVHRATLLDGREVVFKVQRPGIGKKIDADLNILAFLARRAMVEYPEVRSFDPLGVLDEFERSINAELDFEKEAKNAERFAELFADKRDIVHIPFVVEALSTRRVLCMEFLQGVQMRKARAAGCDMALVGQRYLEVAYDMLFEHGFFHGDLHPGNVVVMEHERLGLLDFGMVGRLTQEMRGTVIQIIFGLQRGDHRTIARLMYDIAIKEERVDFRAVERDTVEIIEEFWSGGSVKDLRLGPYVIELTRRASKRGARIPSAYTMFFKAIVTSEGLAKSLIEEVDPIEAAEPYIKAFLKRQLSEEHLRQELLYSTMTLTSLARRLPGSISQVLDDIEGQRVRFQVVDPNAVPIQASADRRVNRAIVAGLTAAAFACGTVALFADTFHPWGVPVVSMAFFAGGMALGGVTLIMLLRNRGPRGSKEF